MEATIILDQLGSSSIWVLVIIAAVANLFPGIPEEVPILLVGVGIGLGLVSFPAALAIIFITLVMGDTLQYLLAYKGSRFIIWFQRVVFRDLVDIHSPFIKKHLKKFVFYSRFIIQVRFLGPFLAGANRMPWHQFISRSAPALFIYLAILLGIGSYFHRPVARMLETSSFSKSITILGLSALLLAIILLFIGPKVHKWALGVLRRGDKKILTKIEK